MLDVHPPHSPTHTWKDFFIHVGTICVGLLIAVGLEQAVEYFHHRHQLHRFEEALRDESQVNLRNIDHDIQLLQDVIGAQEANRASLLASMEPGSHPPIRFIEHPLSNSDSGLLWATPTDAVWAGARDSNLLPSIPANRASNLSRLDVVVASVIGIQHQLFDQEYHVLGCATLRNDVNALTAPERESLLEAISQFQQVAAHAIYQLQRARTVIETQ